MLRKGYVDTPRGQLHYCTDGEGVPVLLLHQCCLSSREFVFVVPMLAEKGYRAIAMDAPGYGNSYKPASPLSVADYGRCAMDLLDGLGLPAVNLAGHHTGSTLAVEIAVNYPDRVDRVVLSGCPFFTPQMRSGRLSDPRYNGMGISEDGSHLGRIWEIVKLRSNLPLMVRHQMFSDHMLAGNSNHALHQAIFRYDEQARFPLIRKPTLVVSGDRDIFIDFLETTRSMIPGARSKVIPGGGPRIALEEPHKLAQAVAEFLGGIDHSGPEEAGMGVNAPVTGRPKRAA